MCIFSSVWLMTLKTMTTLTIVEIRTKTVKNSRINFELMMMWRRVFVRNKINLIVKMNWQKRVTLIDALCMNMTMELPNTLSPRLFHHHLRHHRVVFWINYKKKSLKIHYFHDLRQSAFSNLEFWPTSTAQ